MQESEFFKAPSRRAQVLAGLALGVLALPFLVLGVLGVRATLSEPEPEPAPLAVFAALGAFGALCMSPTWRLVLGKRRRGDGGLLPPAALRAGGVFFLVAPIAILFEMPWAFLEAGGLLGAGIACFALARHRDRRSAPPPPSAEMRAKEPR
jgi:hypothetical protein